MQRSTETDRHRPGRIGHPQQPMQAQPFGRKKGTACTRCRSQKIRCDDNKPSCGNCARAGHPCVRASGQSTDAVLHLAQVEARLRSLEDALRRVAPEELEKAPPVTSFHADSVTQGPAVGEPTAAWPDQGIPSGIHQDAVADDHGLQGVFNSSPHPCQSPASGDAAERNPAASTAQIGPSEPLAHEVGLLSLSNSKESKYLGPSSGVSLARLIFSAIPQFQGLAASSATARGSVRQRTSNHPDTVISQPFPKHWTPDVELQNFVNAYFDTYQPLYPFLDEDTIAECLETVFVRQSQGNHSHKSPQLAEMDAALSSVHVIQIFLIIALGARVIENRLATDFSSERYLATAMVRIESSRLPLYDSIEGLQIMLLLTLSSFHFENGLNAWFLTSALIAACLDLGFQRRWTDTLSGISHEDRERFLLRKNLRSGIFWTSYSIERTLSVVLGRPLTLRDEAIDVEFPGDGGSVSTGSPATSQDTTANPTDSSSSTHPSKIVRMDVSPYKAGHYSFLFDRITAEIKLMLYRVVNLPDRFPWPTDMAEWQQDIQRRCDTLLEDLLQQLKWRCRRNVADTAIRSLELKYHFCVMLLHRPSPAIPRPSVESWKECHTSAARTIEIYSDLHRFSKLPNSWLTAHTIFVSGITFLYCLWVRSEIKKESSLDALINTATACTNLLKFLGKTWTVAADAVETFERLVHMTTSYWRGSEGTAELAVDQSLMNMYDTQSADGAAAAHLLAGAENEFSFEPEPFYDELGDISTWFDLHWIMSYSSSSGPTVPFP